MANQKRSASPERQKLSGVEQLGLRVSAMINHPMAQQQRWVKIHRLDSDGEREWDEVMRRVAETEGIEIASGEDGCITLAWAASSDEDPRVEKQDEFHAMDTQASS